MNGVRHRSCGYMNCFQSQQFEYSVKASDGPAHFAGTSISRDRPIKHSKQS